MFLSRSRWRLTVTEKHHVWSVSVTFQAWSKTWHWHTSAVLLYVFQFDSMQFTLIHELLYIVYPLHSFTLVYIWLIYINLLHYEFCNFMWYCGQVEMTAWPWSTGYCDMQIKWRNVATGWTASMPVFVPRKWRLLWLFMFQFQGKTWNG